MIGASRINSIVITCLHSIISAASIARDEELVAGLTRGSYHLAILYPN